MREYELHIIYILLFFRLSEWFLDVIVIIVNDYCSCKCSQYLRFLCRICYCWCFIHVTVLLDIVSTTMFLQLLLYSTEIIKVQCIFNVYSAFLFFLSLLWSLNEIKPFMSVGHGLQRLIKPIFFGISSLSISCCYSGESFMCGSWGEHNYCCLLL